MEKALAEFAVKARVKFKQGIEEHNPNGDKGLLRMSLNQKLTAIREEIIDLWFYVAAIEAATNGKDAEEITFHPISLVGCFHSHHVFILLCNL